MSHIHDMYRLVKLVQKTNRQNDRATPPPQTLTGYSSRFPATLVIKQRFIKRRPWLSLADAACIVADAIDANYIEGTTSNIPNMRVKVDVLRLKTKGRKLIERSWVIFPTGLWSAWYKENGKLFLTMMLSLATLLAAIVGLLAKVVLFGSSG